MTLLLEHPSYIFFQKIWVLLEILARIESDLSYLIETLCSYTKDIVV